MKGLNKEVLLYLGITDDEFFEWCENKNLDPYKRESKHLFVEELMNNIEQIKRAD